MRYLELDEGVRLSRIGLGAWQFGREWGYGDDFARHGAVPIVRRALDLGVNLVDTAELYGFGRSERIVGEGVAGRHEDAWIATKLFPVAPLPPVMRWRARASARRLGTDRIDLYQLHWPNPVVPVRVQAAGLRRLLWDGLVREVGVSNYPLSGWLAIEAALGRRVLSNQVAYNLVQRAPERELLGYAEAAGRVIIAYSPLAMGLLGGRYTSERRPGGLRAVNPLFSAASLRHARSLIETLREVGAAHDLTAAQVALAWVLHRPNVVAIPGASSVEQVEANVAAADVRLEDSEYAALSRAANAFRQPSGTTGS